MFIITKLLGRVRSSLIRSVIFDIVLWSLLYLLMQISGLKDTLYFSFSLTDSIIMGFVLGAFKFEINRGKKTS